ncbi:MAG: branched-chain amino acid ABC transporter permease [Pseudomonadota bacterium]
MGDLTLEFALTQMTLGLVNGSFYALLSLGLCIIFGILDVVNFAHGAMYMMGAFIAWMLLHFLGLSYWWSLILAPLAIGALGAVLERTMFSRLYGSHHIFGFLLAFGLVLMIEAIFRVAFAGVGTPYAVPPELRGVFDLGYMVLPIYRAWVLAISAAVCFVTWLVIERTRLGSYLRAAIDKPDLVAAFGVNVPRLITLTFAFGCALAALGGVLAAPISPVSPLMGQSIIVVIFAVVVIGGLGSIVGSVVGGYLLGMVEGLCKAVFPEASYLSIFIIMIVVLMTTKSGIAGRKAV